MTNEIFAPVMGAATRTVHRRIAVASAFAGVIVAAIILMTPNVYFEQFIVASGLPGAIDAAAPPLGVKARLAFAIIAAGGIGAIAFAIFSLALARKGSGQSKRMSPEDEFFAFTPPAPRRRADSHPDAPPRPPINAGDDLGTPLDLVDIVTDEPASEVEKVENCYEPVWEEDLDAAEDRFADSAAGPAAEADEPWDTGEQPEAEKGPETGEQPEADAAAFDSPVADPTLADEQIFEAAAEYDFEPDAEDADRREDSPAAEQPADPAHCDLKALVDRLEAGIERRRHRSDLAANDADRAISNITPHPVTRSGRDGELQGALRDALDALHKLNANG